AHPLPSGEPTPLPFPLRDQCRSVANIDAKAADPLFIKREIYIVSLVLLEQVDDRIEGGLVIHKAHLEEEPDFAHPHLSVRLIRTTVGAPAHTRRPPAYRYRSSGYPPAKAPPRMLGLQSGGGDP